MHSWKCNACCVMYSMKTYILYYLFCDARAKISIYEYISMPGYSSVVSVWAIWRVIRTNKFYEFVIALFMLVVFFFFYFYFICWNKKYISAIVHYRVIWVQHFAFLHKRFVSLLILFVSDFNGEAVMQHITLMATSRIIKTVFVHLIHVYGFNFVRF